MVSKYKLMLLASLELRWALRGVWGRLPSLRESLVRVHREVASSKEEQWSQLCRQFEVGRAESEEAVASSAVSEVLKKRPGVHRIGQNLIHSIYPTQGHTHATPTVTTTTTADQDRGKRLPQR